MDFQDQLTYYIRPNNTQLAKDWLLALRELLTGDYMLEKNFCFMGWPDTARTLEYLCEELNKYIRVINQANQVWQKNGLDLYIIEEWFSPDVVRWRRISIESQQRNI